MAESLGVNQLHHQWDEFMNEAVKTEQEEELEEEELEEEEDNEEEEEVNEEEEEEGNGEKGEVEFAVTMDTPAEETLAPETGDLKEEQERYTDPARMIDQDKTDEAGSKTKLTEKEQNEDISDEPAHEAVNSSETQKREAVLVSLKDQDPETALCPSTGPLYEEAYENAPEERESDGEKQEAEKGQMYEETLKEAPTERRKEEGQKSADDRAEVNSKEQKFKVTMDTTAEETLAPETGDLKKEQERYSDPANM